MTIKIDGGRLTLDDVARFLEGPERVVVSSKVISRLKKVRRFIDRKLASHEPFYGINTGFGFLADRRIPDDDLEKISSCPMPWV